MYRALPVSRQVYASTGRGFARASRRRLTTEAPTTSTPAAPKKKKRVLRNITLGSTVLVGTFYAGSAFVAFNSQTYYDYFSDNVPLGAAMLEYAEEHNWDTITLQTVMGWPQASYAWTIKTAEQAKEFVENPKAALEKARKAAEERSRAATEKAKHVASRLKTEIQPADKEKTLEDPTAAATTKHMEEQFASALNDLVHKAEQALAGDIKPEQVETSPQPPAEPTPVEATTEATQDPSVYSSPLPLGFEPPPGYSRPQPPKPASEPAPEAAPEPVTAPAPPLPLVAPSVAEIGVSDPVITQLASTIDNLASFLSANPTASDKAADILDSAKNDLTALSSRMEQAKEEERHALEQRLDEQTREYTVKLLELEMEAQDRLDNQEEGFRQFFAEQKAQITQAYREKLEHELRTQTELINERLKEEVIAQGIEMQRRWIREIKVRVEQERGGRLAKIEELSAQLKRLERIAIDNSSYLDENIRVHALWSALRTLHGAVDAGVRKPFREELRVLRHITEAREDDVASSVLQTLEASDVPDYGVEPFADLATWFTTSVAPRVTAVALVPDQNAGLLSHLASHFFSTFRFQRHGLVEGSDVISVLARAEYYMNEKNLDSAARELNQLKGTAKVLLHDWLEAARRRLEVQQALQVLETQATLASLLVV